MMEFLAVILFFIAFISMSFFWRIKKDDFLASESNRCLNNFCQVDDNWNSNGKVYTKGLAVVQKDGKKQFIKQAKLCDIGILE